MLLNYVDEGKGETIVFLHGMTASLRYWEGYVPLLSKNHRVVRLDLLGFGHSPVSDDGYGVDAHVKAIDETLKHLNINGPFTLVGHSMGSLLALKYATRHPSKVSRLVLLSMPVYTSPEQARQDITKSKRRLRYAYYGLSSRILCTTWCRFLRPFSSRLAPFYLRSQPAHVAQDSVLHTWQAYARSMQHVIEEQSVAQDMATLSLPISLIYGTDESKTILSNAHRLKLGRNVHRQELTGSHNVPLEQTVAISRLLQ